MTSPYSVESSQHLSLNKYFPQISVPTWSMEQMILEMVHVRRATGVTRAVWTAAVLRFGKQMDKLRGCYSSWTVSFPKQRQMRDASPGNDSIENHLDRPRKKWSILHTVKEEMNIINILKSKGNWIGHILRWNCLLKHFIELTIEAVI
jgi:hypothetical protein